MDNTQETCRNCGYSFTGKFCNRCGEKIYNEQDKSVTHLFHEVFHFFTHFDGAFPTTVKTIITKPGQYALDYCSGIRKRYFKPIPLFLLLVILYLLFPAFQGLNMRAGTYVDDQYNYSWFAIPVVKNKMKKKGVKYEVVAKMYDEKSPKIAKLCLFLLIPMSALITSLLFYTSKRLFYDHFVLSAEISSFYIFFVFLFIPAIASISILISPSTEAIFRDDSWLSIALAILTAAFILLAFKRFFGQRWGWSTLKAILFFTIFSAGLKYLYAMIIFYLTMLFI